MSTAQSPALAVLESALRARHLDGTLTAALPSVDLQDERIAGTGIPAMDTCLGGGIPLGQLSELVGPRSSGRTTVWQAMAAAATGRGELVALVDTFDRLDVESAVAAGIDLGRLLWIRGQAISRTDVGVARGWRGSVTGPAGTGDAAGLLERTIDRALKAWTQVLQAGGFGLAVLDLADAPIEAIRRLPFTTWLRLQRTVRQETAALLVAPAPVGRSAAGVTLQMQPSTRAWARDTRTGPSSLDAARDRVAPASSAQPVLAPPAGRWTAGAVEATRFEGLDVSLRLVSSRRRDTDDEVMVTCRAE